MWEDVFADITKRWLGRCSHVNKVYEEKVVIQSNGQRGRERECEALVIFFLSICISYNKEAVKVSPIAAARGIDQLD